MNGRMSMKTVRDINSRLFFSSGDAGERGAGDAGRSGVT